MLYKCSKCDYRSTIGQLILHRRRHQKENIEEYIHSNSANFRDQKDKQMSSEDKDILYKCFVCNLICTSPGALIFHERTHRKVHKCSFCIYSCTSYAELEIHTKSHRNNYDSLLKENDYPYSDTISQKNYPQLLLPESNPLKVIQMNTRKQLVKQADFSTDITDNFAPHNFTETNSISFITSGDESDPCIYSEDLAQHSLDYVYEADEIDMPEYRGETITPEYTETKPDIQTPTSLLPDSLQSNRNYITKPDIQTPTSLLPDSLPSNKNYITKPDIQTPTLLLPDSLQSNRNYIKNIETKQFPNVPFGNGSNTVHQEQHTVKSEHIEIPTEDNQTKHSSYEICILCKPNKTSTREKVEVKTIKGRKALCHASKLRHDNLYDELKTASPLCVHVDCRWDYVNLQKLTKNHKSPKNNKNSGVNISEELFDFHSLCLYCGLNAEIKNPKPKNLSVKGNVALVDNLEFQEEANEIYEKYSCIDQPTKKSLRRMKTVCLLNERARYHIKCYDAFVNHVIETSCFQKAFRKLCKYIDSNEKGLYKLSSLKKFMTKCSPLSLKNINSLKLNLASYYGKRMLIIQCENEELVTFNNKFNKRHNKLINSKRMRRDVFGSFIKLDIDSVDSVCSFIKKSEDKIINTSASSRSLPSLHFTSQLPSQQDMSDSLSKSPENNEYNNKLNDFVIQNQNTSIDLELKVKNNSQLLSLNMKNEELHDLNAENYLSTNLLQKLEKGLCNLNESGSSSSTDGDLNISAISVYDTVQENQISLETDVDTCTIQGHSSLELQNNDVIGTSELSPLQRKPSLKEKFLNKIWRRDKVSPTESSGCGKRKSIISNEVMDIDNTMSQSESYDKKNKMGNFINHSINVDNLTVESHVQGPPDPLVDERYRNKVISVAQNISSEGVHSVRTKLFTSSDNKKLFNDTSESRATIILDHTNEKSVNIYQCITCHELLKKGNVMSHLKIHKKDLHIECNICSKNFFTKISHFEKHYLWHMEEKTYECELCKKCFPSSNSLKVHMKLHAKQVSYTCKLCSVEFTRESCLIRHQELHRKERFKCYICYKMFNSKSSLEFHMKLHSTKKTSDSNADNNLNDKVTKYHNDPEVCKEAKNSKGNLKPHPNEISFKCEECSKIFSQYSHLETHMLRHSKEKLHQCDKCDKKFRSKKERTLHMKLHTVPKVFVCKVCSAEFTRRSNLQSHERGHLE